MASTLNRYAAYLMPWAVLLAIVSWLALAAPARASNCRQFFHQQVQQVVAVQAYAPVYYAAGAGIEQDALAAKITRQVVAQLRQEFTTGGLKQQQTSNQSAIAIHCGKCHSGPAPKAQVTYDGVTALACFQVTAAIRAISTDHMPKDHKLTPDQKGQLLQELLDLEADRTKPVEVPQPEQTGILK